ncbi:MAG: class I poly(R)-hydroxyalkanoic acid synthase, partial [Pseudomonadota bacterium]
AIEGLDDKSRASLAFWTGQVSDALSPANFAMTNPAVLREMVESKGESLVRGLENLLHDLEASKGPLTISMCDPNAFTLGENIATSKGQVVWQNALMQLIQYAPATEQVLQAPLLILPPWINKFYVLDLQPGNSFIKWCVDQGLTVFVVSWVNPDASYRDTGFDDYMRLGVFEALDAIEQACGASKVHALGYCLGGTLLATAMAVMKARGDTRIQSATLLTTMLDFSEPGELGVFTDETQIEALEQKMEARGFLEGNEMAGTFSMMRANDLIWFFVINNYLLGKAPKPFDLLYWNSDSTRMPAAMHSFYLRRMYLENKLAKPAGITIDSVPIDLGSVKVPTFVLATLEDHIAPWQSAWKATKLLGGKVEFVLSGSGHIAGVINPPSTGKYPHWTNKGPNKARFDNAEAWLENAERQSGSWWPSWFSWLCGHSKKLVPARTPGDSKLECIEAAPGSYVRQRFDQKT